MEKYLISGGILLVLALLSTGDVIITVLGGMLFIPGILGIQIVIYFACGKIKKLKSRQGIISLIPIVLLAAFILLKLSVWVQPNETFKLALGCKMPPSINNFIFEDSSFTDCVIEFYCEINPNDLLEIIQNKNFRRQSYHHEKTFSFERFHWMKNKPPPIKNYILYEYTILGSDGDLIGGCSLYTNKKHNRIFVIYSVD